MINCKGFLYTLYDCGMEPDKEKKQKYNYHVKKLKMFIGTQDKLNDLNCEVDDFLESVNGTVIHTDIKREKDGTIILSVTYAVYPYRK